jgi:hypothetical protein
MRVAIHLTSEDLAALPKGLQHMTLQFDALRRLKSLLPKRVI